MKSQRDQVHFRILNLCQTGIQWFNDHRWCHTIDQPLSSLGGTPRLALTITIKSVSSPLNISLAMFHKRGWHDFLSECSLFQTLSLRIAMNFNETNANAEFVRSYLFPNTYSRLWHACRLTSQLFAFQQCAQSTVIHVSFSGFVRHVSAFWGKGRWGSSTR